MRINKARVEARALGIMLQRFPHSCGREEWGRMQYLRTFILTHNLKHKEASKDKDGTI